MLVFVVLSNMLEQNDCQSLRERLSEQHHVEEQNRQLQDQIDELRARLSSCVYKCLEGCPS